MSKEIEISGSKLKNIFPAMEFLTASNRKGLGDDVKLFDIAGFGIAFRAQDLVKDLATVTLDVKDLSQIVGLINSHYNLELELQAS